MSLDRLPEEILIIILRQLDLKTVCNLFDTGNKHLQNAICSQGAIKQCRLSISSMATVQTLKLDFFKSISHNLQELDLSAVQGLSKSTLLPAMKKMKSLVTLNVAYTNITIFDLQEIRAICPTIKSITINYQFHKVNSKKRFFPQEKLIKCQDLFANFDNVHFVGSIDNLLYSNMPINLLQKAKLNSLTYTIAQDDKMFTYYKYAEKKTLNCNKIIINILFWKNLCLMKSFKDSLDIIKDLSFEYEYIHISDCTINISPAFTEYFRENFRYNRVCIKPKIASTLVSKSNHYIMIWNKETTSFDDAFFQELDSKVKQLEPGIVTYSEGMAPVTLTNDWVCVIHPLLPESNKRTQNYGFKKRRVTSTNVTIDYDDLFESKKNVELTICFYDHIQRPVTLSASSNFLKKLTFLQLRGAVRYSREFFNILFRCCENLITLDVEGIPASPCAPPISRSVPLSRSLKNLRIVDKSIDLNTLFSSLGQCSKLENIMILDNSKVFNSISSVDTLFQQCENLYYLCVCGFMTDTAKTKKLTMMNKAREKYNRDHLCIEIITYGNPDYFYDPFVDVFRLVVSENHVA